MPTVIPPWISSGPGDFAHAAEAGLSAGVQRTGIAQQAATAQAEIQARAAQAAAALQAEQARFALMSKIHAQQVAQQHDIQQQRINILDAYHKQQGDLGLLRVNQRAQAESDRNAIADRLASLRENVTPKTQVSKIGNDLYEKDPDTGEWKAAVTGEQPATVTLKEMAERDKLQTALGNSQRSILNPARWMGNKFDLPGGDEQAAQMQEEIKALNSRIKVGGIRAAPVMAPPAGAVAPVGITHVYDPATKSIKPVGSLIAPPDDEETDDGEE